MNVAITYHEAQELISKQFNLKLGLSMADGRTMSVEYNPGLLLPTVRVDIHIEAIQGNTLILTYKCIPAVALLVQGAVKLLGDREVILPVKNMLKTIVFYHRILKIGKI